MAEKNDPIQVHQFVSTNPTTSSWWCQIFLIFTPTWGRFQFWLIFFRCVDSTTNPTCRGVTTWWPPGRRVLCRLPLGYKEEPPVPKGSMISQEVLMLGGRMGFCCRSWLILGKMPILTNIFQLGWNHQLVINLMVGDFFFGGGQLHIWWSFQRICQSVLFFLLECVNILRWFGMKKDSSVWSR